MPEAEQLPKNQPAEVHVDGIPLFTGEISAALDQGLLMIDAKPMRGKIVGKTINVPTGAAGELVFKQMFDDEGGQIIVPIGIVGAEGTDVTLEFRDPVSVVTGTALRKLKAKPRKRPQAAASGDTELLPEFRKRALRQAKARPVQSIMTLRPKGSRSTAASSRVTGSQV